MALVHYDRHADDLPSIDDLLQRPPWQRDALCAEPEYRDLNWFPKRGESTAEAKEVCRRCLVREECLAFALSSWDTTFAGIWGGTSGRERRRGLVSSDGAPRA